MTALEMLLFLALLVVNGFLAMARAALVNVRKARLRQLAEEGGADPSNPRAGSRTARRAALALRLSEDASRLLATTQVGMMLNSFFAAAVVAVLSTQPLADTLQPWLGTASTAVAFVLVVLLTALVMLIFGELVPETIAVQHSERLALWLARPLSIIVALAMPLVRLTVALSNGIAQLFGARPQGDLPMVTEEEIKTLVDAGEEEGVIEEEEKAMIYSIFELGDTLARQVMVPRIDLVALDVTTPLLEALDAIMQAGHSRIPVYDETIDNIQGVLYAKDLLPYLREGRTDVPLKSILREAYFIPETKRAGDLLPDLQQRRVHVAIVVDEYGGVAGLVTIEDILEEIVGEIQDEYDTEEPFVEYISDEEGQWSAYLLDARVDLGDLNQLLDSALPTEGSDTLGGFIYSELGKVPVVGDRIEYQDLDFTVESVAGRRIKKVRVERHLPVEQDSDAVEDAVASAGG